MSHVKLCFDIEFRFIRCIIIVFVMTECEMCLQSFFSASETPSGCVPYLKKDIVLTLE